MKIQIRSTLGWIGLFMLLIFLTAGCSSEGQSSGQSKEEIEKTLSSQSEVSDKAWSPNNGKVIYLKESVQNPQGEIYVWKAGEKEPQLIKELSQAPAGFLWSPDSTRVLIGEKKDPKIISTILNGETFVEDAYRIESIGFPVWSPDSLTLAYSNEVMPVDMKWGSVEVYRLGEEKGEYLRKTQNYQYTVDQWEAGGDILYTEINDQGQKIQKKARNIRPSISGVHLGDSMEQVRTALGKEYKEYPPDDEIFSYPEPVYRWEYEKGYIIIIGKDSGGVLEIYATDPQAETNLGVKIGDKADQVFALYRKDYVEPVSIHGGKLTGVFKVEIGAAVFFNFDIPRDQSRESIQEDSRVESIRLTYPEMMDDSF